MTENQKKILVVEDDKFLMKIYQNKLQQLDYALLTATDGEEAVKITKEQKPNLILLDIMIPKKSGFDVLSSLKQDTECTNIPVMLLSNLGQETDLQKGKELGAVDYIIKSNTSIEEVVEKINKYINTTEPPTLEEHAQDTEAKSGKFCKGCNTDIDVQENAQFCPQCGKKFE